MRTGDLKTYLERQFTLRLNKNQAEELSRLFFEIKKRENLDDSQIIRPMTQNEKIRKISGKEKFLAIKKELIKMRFPLSSQQGQVNPREVFLSRLKDPLADAGHPSSIFRPEKIFVEKKAKNSYLSKRFQEYFPNVPAEEIDHCWEYPKKNVFRLEELKKPYVFIVRENWDFIRPCPCTKDHLGCNYWIFNLGFGCPFDCSYCFLQQYTNFPGIVLPANLDDFFFNFDNFYDRIKNKPIRIGTGEFCDSLALDHITGYSKQLVDFFRDKNVFFELKTKSDNISLLLETAAAENIVISWSLAPQEKIDQEEINVAGLKKRLNAAKKIQDKGYSLAFHFDPVIHSNDWEKEYRNLIEEIYRELKPPFRWISIGTLRGTRKLKNTAEQRFPQSSIFYGELLLGKDKKLRYPEFLRKDIYEKLCALIREKDEKTPVYLCMEDADCWQVMDRPMRSSREIEDYLCGKKQN